MLDLKQLAMGGEPCSPLPIECGVPDTTLKVSAFNELEDDPRISESSSKCQRTGQQQDGEGRLPYARRVIEARPSSVVPARQHSHVGSTTTVDM